MNIVITGGAGFIGINTAAYFLQKKYRVTIIDNFSREGSRSNAKWLQRVYPRNVRVVAHDLRYHPQKLERLVSDAGVVIHLAGQVAVTTSVLDPVADCEINIRGTINLLEAARHAKHKPIVLYSSTNKVYGALENVGMRGGKTRYSFPDLPYGISEQQPLDFHSPYGCSKGAADQYVRDYYRIYGLPTVVFRQSCIYGPHQHGMEDQGWVAWFIIRLLQKGKITIFGNGKQVRDILYVSDLVDAYDAAIRNIKTTRGKIYNIGGGYKNTISVWHEFRPILEGLFGRKVTATFSDWRPGDQPIYVSDIRRAEKDFGWNPAVSPVDGIRMTYDWLKKNYEK